MLTVAHPIVLGLLLVLPVLTLLTGRARRRRRRAWQQLAEPSAWFRLAPTRPRHAWVVAQLRSLGLSLLVLAASGPFLTLSVAPADTHGRDVVALLDLSHSMLAQDVLPSRLERARAALNELADELEQHGGYRVGLVVFAARGQVLCPLTRDLDHFRGRLRQIEPAFLPTALQAAAAGSPSGTRFGAGLTTALSAIDKRFVGCQDVIMLSDGDDPVGVGPIGDREWADGIRAAQDAQVRVFTVGIGDPDEACPIPDASGQPLRSAGREIRTRLHEEPLREIARETGGAYRAARREAVQLGRFFREHIAVGPIRDLDEDVLPAPQPRRTACLASALALLLLTAYASRRIDSPGGST